MPLPARVLAFLFSARARVYNFRIIMVAAVVTLALLVITYVQPWTLDWDDVAAEQGIVQGIVGCSLVLVHHPIAVIPTVAILNAAFDLGALIAEIALITRAIQFYYANGPTLTTTLITVSVITYFKVFAAIMIFTLSLAVFFRLATIFSAIRHREMARLGFLGSCEKVYPPYTPKTILLNRSVTRPLVRGEAVWIIVLRALVISILGVALPAFGIYSIFIHPYQAEIFIRPVADATYVNNEPWNIFDGDSSFIITGLGANLNTTHTTFNVTAAGYWTSKAECKLEQAWAGRSASPAFLATCPKSNWNNITSVTISAVLPEGALGVNVALSAWYSRHGEHGWGAYLSAVQSPSAVRGAPEVLPVSMVAGSRRIGQIRWTARLRHSSPEWIYIPEVFDLGLDPSNATGLSASASADTNPTHAVLTLINTYTSRSLGLRYEEETTDSSVLSGISDLGGFWTFVNGSFALLFGANIVYFAFGRRPLSALGVAHVFQRGELERGWREDFPRLDREGGRPGDREAGVVAFVRERLVDLGEGPGEERGVEEEERTLTLSSKEGYCHTSQGSVDSLPGR
ncbi:Short-chain dehydrogenase/reductase family protein [Mycena kentingensis (nom. inval.)]|nr:Short-chain dehydrogenase/reductase family protein [Mycena kentingensis (nom. inval.)]